MNSNDVTEIVQAYIDAFNASDADAMLALVHEDVAHDLNQDVREIGKEKFRWTMAQRAKHFDEQLDDCVIMVAQGANRSAAECTLTGKYVQTAEGMSNANGQSYAVRTGLFFEIDDGLITRISSSYNLADFARQLL